MAAVLTLASLAAGATASTLWAWWRDRATRRLHVSEQPFLLGEMMFVGGGVSAVSLILLARLFGVAL